MDAPGVHVNVSVVLGESGDKEVLVRVGVALRMVTLAVAVGPSEMPSVGVTFTVHRSDFVVVLLGRTEVVLAEDTTPFSSHSYRYVTLPPSGSTLGAVIVTLKLSVVYGVFGVSWITGCEGIPLTSKTVWVVDTKPSVSVAVSVMS